MERRRARRRRWPRSATPLRARRPDLDWDGRERMTGDEPLGLGDATTALEELADLDDAGGRARARTTPAPASTTSTRRRSAARSAGRPSTTWRRCAASSASWSARATCGATRGKLELTPKAVRRLGETALRRVFASLDAGGRGDHDQRDAGAAGELTGVDPAVAVRRRAAASTWSARWSNARAARRPPPAGSAASGCPSTTSRCARPSAARRAAVCLLVDLSYSMVLRGTWARRQADRAGAARPGGHASSRRTPCRSSASPTTRGCCSPTSWPGLDWDMVQGTNLHHALMLAGRHLDRHPDFEPVVLVVTDGEPTAHLHARRPAAVRLAAVAGDARADPGRGGQDDPARGDAQRLHARRRRAAAWLRRRGRPPQRRPGVLARAPTGSASTWSATSCATAPAGDRAAPRGRGGAARGAARSRRSAIA